MPPQLHLPIHCIPVHLHLKMLPWHPSAVERDHTPASRARGYMAVAKPEAETSHTEGAQWAGIRLGAARLLCVWKVTAMEWDDTPATDLCSHSPSGVKDGFTPALHHSACLESPSSKSGLWNRVAEGKHYFLKKPYKASVQHLQVCGAHHSHVYHR